MDRRQVVRSFGLMNKAGSRVYTGLLATKHALLVMTAVAVLLFAAGISNIPKATAAATIYGLWPTTATPAATTTASTAMEVGVRFQASTDGYVSGIKFYKGAGNTGIHYGNIWSASGTKLATLTYPNETANGWQTGYFSQPYKITANTPYVVSYSAPKGHFSYTQNYFKNKTVTTNQLTAKADAAAAPNGLYGNAGNFPKQGSNATNFWVDPLYSTANPSSTAPSGEDMPVGDLANWKQVYTQDFTATTAVDWSNIYPYTGVSGATHTQWSADDVSVSGGLLHLKAVRASDGTWTAGAVSFWAPGTVQTYGKYQVRMKIPQAKGLKYAYLLWPTDNNWPADGEIDFAEDGGGTRIGTNSTTHYGTSSSPQQLQLNLAGIDFSQWQTVGVEWSPGKIVYTINGNPWGTVTTPAAAIPSTEMFLALQTEVITDGSSYAVDSTTPPTIDNQIDWVTMYAPK